MVDHKISNIVHRTRTLHDMLSIVLGLIYEEISTREIKLSKTPSSEQGTIEILKEEISALFCIACIVTLIGGDEVEVPETEQRTDTNRL